MTIELDAATQTITLDGVKISLQLLKALAHPDSHALYAIERKENTVYITPFYNVPQDKKHWN